MRKCVFLFNWLNIEKLLYAHLNDPKLFHDCTFPKMHGILFSTIFKFVKLEGFFWFRWYICIFYNRRQSSCHTLKHLSHIKAVFYQRSFLTKCCVFGEWDGYMLRNLFITMPTLPVCDLHHSRRPYCPCQRHSVPTNQNHDCEFLHRTWKILWCY